MQVVGAVGQPHAQGCCSRRASRGLRLERRAIGRSPRRQQRCPIRHPARLRIRLRPAWSNNNSQHMETDVISALLRMASKKPLDGLAPAPESRLHCKTNEHHLLPLLYPPDVSPVDSTELKYTRARCWLNVKDWAVGMAALFQSR